MLTGNITGSRSALGVILNVEQYEYMAGPDQETGIKVSISTLITTNVITVIIT